MAGEVTRSQALLYAQDLKDLYEGARGREEELALAYRRLQSAYQQSLRYAQDLRDIHQRLQRAILQSLLGLANALEAKDPYTRGHSERVARMARRLAEARGLSQSSAQIVAQAGLLHDLGKIGIPGAILRKPAPLTEAEWEAMRQHPVVGAQIVAPLEFFAEGAFIVRHHHERVDGSGYPDRLAGEAIPLGARIVAVADVYDALTSDRPYRSRLPYAQATVQLQAQAGRALDGELVGAFCDLLSDGCLGPAL
jgi:HD-GYP domain-containing protein (c-di-GMP phosphodiesterase class II)